MTGDDNPFPGSSGALVKVTPEILLDALGLPPMPTVEPNILPSPGIAPADQGQSALAAAGNIGVLGDVASGAQLDLDRRAHLADGARKFPANEADVAQDKPVEKRVSAPGVPNGQPVKGRLTVPASVPVKTGNVKPPVVTKLARRIVVLPTDEEAKE